MEPSQRLKVETCDAHHRLEVSLSVDELFATRASYAEFLRRLTGVQLPAEATVCAWLDDRLFASETRAEWLRCDLQWLLDEQPRVDLADFDWVTSASYAAGVAYVLEGAALGGRVLRQQAQQRLRFVDENGVRFFSGHGEATMTRWQQVRIWLDHNLCDNDQVDTATEAARRTFQIFQAALEGGL
ncbi:MAG: biliverdin-producing heme oxygenase [Planctomycetales bacterium]|nr:biliverdin-producing heme oxygenase [Planctomycetales bacterium]